MRIAIYAVGVGVGGGGAILKGLIRGLLKTGRNDERLDVYSTLEAPMAGTTWIRLPRILASPVLRLAGERYCAKQIERTKPEVVLSLTGFPLKLPVPQVTLITWPYGIYGAEEVLHSLPWRERIWKLAKIRVFNCRLSRSSILVVQTEDAAQNLRERVKPEQEVRIISPAHTDMSQMPSKNKLLVCLSRYYPHKNLEILVEVGKLIKQRGRPYLVLTTVEHSDHPKAGGFMRRIEEEQLSNTLWNCGQIPPEWVLPVLSRSDGLLLPSLLESFSMAYLDALAVGLPIFTADRPHARAVCGSNAVYFDPRDPEAILSALDSHFAAAGGSIEEDDGLKMRDWTDVAEDFRSALKAAHERR